MTLWVDFNRMDARGRIPTTLRGSQAWTLEEGQIVLVEDGEGTRCKAYIEELRRAVSDAKSVAYLALIPGSVDTDPRVDWLTDDLDEHLDAHFEQVAEEEAGTFDERGNFERLVRRLSQVPKKELDDLEHKEATEEAHDAGEENPEEEPPS